MNEVKDKIVQSYFSISKFYFIGAEKRYTLLIFFFRKGGPEVCPPDYKESDDQTFWVYFALRFFGTTMLSAGVTIMDPIALMMIEKYGGDFGRERLFSSIGMAIFSPITGRGKGYRNNFKQ